MADGAGGGAGTSPLTSVTGSSNSTTALLGPDWSGATNLTPLLGAAYGATGPHGQEVGSCVCLCGSYDLTVFYGGPEVLFFPPNNFSHHPNLLSGHPQPFVSRDDTSYFIMRQFFIFFFLTIS